MAKERVWVLSSAAPKEAAGNGLHYFDCYTFRDRANHPPRLATPEERATLPPCSKCGDEFGRRSGFCPVCSYSLTASGQCSNDRCPTNE